jgi:hypothetical protein
LCDGDAADEENLNGFYLIGLGFAKKERKEGKTKPKRDTVDEVMNTLRTYEDGIRRNERYYDAGEMFVSVGCVGCNDLPKGVRCDGYVWVDDGFEDDEDEECEEGDAGDAGADGESDFSLGVGVSGKHRRKKRGVKTKTAHVPAMKLVRHL